LKDKAISSKRKSLDEKNKKVIVYGGETGDAELYLSLRRDVFEKKEKEGSVAGREKGPQRSLDLGGRKSRAIAQKRSEVAGSVARSEKGKTTAKENAEIVYDRTEARRGLEKSDITKEEGVSSGKRDSSSGNAGKGGRFWYRENYISEVKQAADRTQSRREREERKPREEGTASKYALTEKKESSQKRRDSAGKEGRKRRREKKKTRGRGLFIAYGTRKRTIPSALGGGHAREKEGERKPSSGKKKKKATSSAVSRPRIGGGEGVSTRPLSGGGGAASSKREGAANAPQEGKESGRFAKGKKTHDSENQEATLWVLSPVKGLRGRRFESKKGRIRGSVGALTENKKRGSPRQRRDSARLGRPSLLQRIIA